MNKSRLPMQVIYMFLATLFTITLLLPSVTFGADLGSRKIKDDEYSGHPKWNKWVWDNSVLEFNGYNRTTYSVTQDGDSGVQFVAPGAQSSYRLGNEPNLNLELALNFKYYLDGNPELGGPKYSRNIQFYSMVDEFVTLPNYDQFRLCLEWEAGSCGQELAQLYTSFNNFVGDGVNVWFGRRWFDRRFIHLNNHFWLNPGQGSYIGGGIEGLKGIAPGNTIDISGFYYRDLSQEQATGEVIDAHTLDVRYRGIKTIPNGKLTLFGQYTNRDGNATLGISDEDGFALGFWHELGDVYGGHWKVAGTYREGASLVQGTFNSRAISEFAGYDLSDASTWELNSDLYIEPGGDWALQWGTVLRNEDRGNGQEVFWASTGIRPIYYINKHVNLAFETGIDYIDNSGGLNSDAEGFVWKNTLALQLTTDRGYFNRPVVRIFGTYASWSDELKGQVGTSPLPKDQVGFANDTDGFVFGVQFESWW